MRSTFAVSAGSNAAVGCVICGIGGWDTTRVLGIFFGLSALGFLLLFLWSLATKQFKDTNAISDDPLRAEEFADRKAKEEEKKKQENTHHAG